MEVIGESFGDGNAGSEGQHKQDSSMWNAGATRSTQLHYAVELWDMSEVENWLRSRQLARFAANFKENDVVGKVLLKLTPKSIRDDLGIQEPYDRLIMDEIIGLERKSMDVVSWSEDDVCNWISALGLKEHIDTFMYHNVSGELLLQLTKKDIEEELEIKKLGHRELLYDEIVKLKQMAARRGARGLSEGYARISQPPQSQVEEIARLEQQRQQRLRKELEDLKRKVVQMRDAETRAKVRARQVETDAGRLEKQLQELQDKTRKRESTQPVKAALQPKPGQRRVIQDHCTFQPKLNANSLKIVEEKTGGQHDFVARMESEKAQRERKLKELIKQQAAGDVDPKVAASREQKRKKQCYAYFKRELGWDTSGGIEEHINKVLDSPESVGLREFIDPAQIRHIRKLRGHEQALCLYDQFCVRDFVKRQVSDMSTRKTGGSDHGGQLREREMTLKAEEYFKDRFKWSKVDAARLNDLLDNANVLELELSEANLVSLRSIKPSQQVRAIYRALQTKAFLQRTMQDIRKREGNMQQMWREHAASMRGLSMHPTSDEAVQNFIDRVEEDLRSRGERFEKLVEKVKSQDPNFKECTFQPQIFHASHSRPKTAPAK